MASTRVVRPRPLSNHERIPIYWPGLEPSAELKAIDGGALYKHLVSASMVSPSKRKRGERYKAPIEAPAGAPTPRVQGAAPKQQAAQGIAIPRVRAVKDHDANLAAIAPNVTAAMENAHAAGYTRYMELLPNMYEEHCFADYDMDSDDEGWLRKLNSKGQNRGLMAAALGLYNQVASRLRQNSGSLSSPPAQPELLLSPDTFEKAVDRLEALHLRAAKDWWMAHMEGNGNAGASSSSGRQHLPGMRTLLPASAAMDELDDLVSDRKLARQVYDYWAAKRQEEGGPLLAQLWFEEPWRSIAFGNDEVEEDAPFSGGSPSTGRRGGGKRRRIDMDDAVDALQRLRGDLEVVRTLADQVRKREKLKRQLLLLWQREWQLRAQDAGLPVAPAAPLPPGMDRLFHTRSEAGAGWVPPSRQPSAEPSVMQQQHVGMDAAASEEEQQEEQQEQPVARGRGGSRGRKATGRGGSRGGNKAGRRPQQQQQQQQQQRARTTQGRQQQQLEAADDAADDDGYVSAGDSSMDVGPRQKRRRVAFADAAVATRLRRPAAVVAAPAPASRGRRSAEQHAGAPTVAAAVAAATVAAAGGGAAAAGGSRRHLGRGQQARQEAAAAAAAAQAQPAAAAVRQPRRGRRGQRSPSPLAAPVVVALPPAPAPASSDSAASDWEQLEAASPSSNGSDETFHASSDEECAAAPRRGHAQPYVVTESEDEPSSASTSMYGVSGEPAGADTCSPVHAAPAARRQQAPRGRQPHPAVPQLPVIAPELLLRNGRQRAAGGLAAVPPPVAVQAQGAGSRALRHRREAAAAAAAVAAHAAAASRVLASAPAVAAPAASSKAQQHGKDARHSKAAAATAAAAASKGRAAAKQARGRVGRAELAGLGLEAFAVPAPKRQGKAGGR